MYFPPQHQIGLHGTNNNHYYAPIDYVCMLYMFRIKL